MTKPKQQHTKEQQNMPFRISREDMLRSKTVTPGWYLCTIKKVENGQAKTDGSDKTDVTFVVKDGIFAGVPVDRTFSAKAPGFATSFIEAMLNRKLDEKGWEGEFEAALGKDIRVYIKNELFMGRMVNKAEDFKPAVVGSTA